MNTENIHKYLQQQYQAKLIAKTGETYCENKTRQNSLQNHQNIGACLKYKFTHKIFASNQDVCAHLKISAHIKMFTSNQNICAHLEISAHTQNICFHLKSLLVCREGFLLLPFND